MKIKEYIEKTHEIAVEKGFWDEEINIIPTKLMLIVSEISEALEAHRKNKFTHIDVFFNRLKKYVNKSENELIKLMNQKEIDFISDFEGCVKNSFEDEIADVFIRLFDLCGYLKIDIEKHIEVKMAYNQTREYKHGKEY